MATDPIWVSVFADGPGGGNPCPVVFDADELSTEQMQALARQYRAETAFVLSAQGEAAARLRYFVPLHEMSMCVHATVASAVLLSESGRAPTSPLSLQTELGVLTAQVNQATRSAVVSQFPPVFQPPVADLAPVLAALRITPAELDGSVGPVRSVSTARPKLMIPVRSEAILNELAPDFEELWRVCEGLGVTGFYPFAIEQKSITARQFPLRAGYPEDPATGVAACALGAFLTTYTAAKPGWHRWTIGQGRTMGRPSLMVAESLVGADSTITHTRVSGPVTDP